MLAAWTVRYGGWVCLAVLGSVCFWRTFSYGSQLALGGLALLALLTSGAARWRNKFPVGTLPAVIFFAVVFLLNAVFSDNPVQSLRAWPFRLWLLLSLPIALAFVDTRPVRRWGLPVLVFGTLAGFAILLLGFWREPADLRPGGNLGTMNYAGVVGLTLPFLLVRLLDSWSRSPNAGERVGGRLAWFLLLAVNACVAGMLVNGTRIVILAAGITTLFVVVCHIRRLNLRTLLALATLPLTAALVFALLPTAFFRLTAVAGFIPPTETVAPVADPLPTFSAPVPEPPAAVPVPTATAASGAEPLAADTVPSLSDFVAETPATVPAPATEPVAADDGGVQAGAVRSTQVRWHLWRRAVEMFAARPVLGHGLRTITEIHAPMRLYDSQPLDPKAPLNFHNTYLQFAAETGALGVLALLGLFAPGLWLAVRHLRGADPEKRMWACIAIALLLELAIHSGTDEILRHRCIPYIFGLLTAWAWTRMQAPPTENPQ